MFCANPVVRLIELINDGITVAICIFVLEKMNTWFQSLKHIITRDYPNQYWIVLKDVYYVKEVHNVLWRPSLTLGRVYHLVMQ